MAKELTAAAVEKLKPGQTRREIPDGRVGGLYFLIQPNGKRSWAMRFRFAGRSRKFTLGQYPAIDLKAARELARQAKGKIESGADPGVEKKAEKAKAFVPANDLVEDVIARFIAQYAKRKLKASTAAEAERLLNKEIVPVWRGRRLSEIKRPDIHNLLDGIIDRAPVTANRTLSWLKRVCSWAIERGLIEANPCGGIKPPAAETSRERILSDDELAAIWQASEGLGAPYRAFVRLLILTGQRRSEIAEMRWKEIDLENRAWTLPAARAKNGRAHQIPMPDQAIEILRILPRIAGSEFAFTVSGKQPITAFDKTKKRLDALLPPPAPAPWTFHDFRRTAASGMARLGVNLPVIEKLLNHVSGSFAGIVGVYQRHSFADEKARAMAAWARHVESIVSGEPAGNVVELASARV